MNIWTSLLLFGAILGLGYTLLSWVMLVVALRKSRRDDGAAYCPPVSVFKPLKGLDEKLEQNLESFFRQRYPQFELIFGVNDLDDPAIDVVRKLQASYPQVATTLIVDTYRRGFNPKVNNLFNMASYARHDLWVISDSNVRVARDYLASLAGQMRDPKVGLVTSLIRGVGGERLGSKLENLHLNSFIAASTVAVSRLSGIPVSIGKSMLIRRETVSRLGGFEAFADYLLEDGLIGRGVHQLGLKTTISMHAVENVNDTWSIRDFMSRHSRWAVMRRRLNLLHYASEILANPVPLMLAGFAVSPTMTSALVLAAVWAVKTTVDLLTIRAVGGAVRISSGLLLPVKDLIIAFLWLKPFVSTRVVWRGNHFQVGPMTRLAPVKRSPRLTLNGMKSLSRGVAQAYRLTRRRLIPRGSEA